jgi:hypothetical protein
MHVELSPFGECLSRKSPEKYAGVAWCVILPGMRGLKSSGELARHNLPAEVFPHRSRDIPMAVRR